MKLKDLFRSRQFALTEFGAVIVEPYALKTRLFFDNSDVVFLSQVIQIRKILFNKSFNMQIEIHNIE